MKKLIILVSLIALLASGMAFAQVTFNGKVEVEVANDFDNDVNSAGVEKWDPDVRIEMNIKADNYNTGYIRMRLNDGAKVGSNRAMVFDKAYFTTDMLGGIGVKNAPLKWVSQFGLNEWYYANVALAGWDITNAVLMRPGKAYDYYFDEKIWGTKQTFSFLNMITIGGFFGLEYDRLQDMYIDAIATLQLGPGKLSAEAAYLLWENTAIQLGLGTPVLDLAQGTMMLAAGFDFNLSGAGMKVGASYYMPLDTEVAMSAYAFNAKATLGLGYLLFGLQGYPENSDMGYDGELLHNVRIAGGIALTPQFGADIGVILYTGGEDTVGGDNETLNTLDASIYAKVGKATFRVGMLMVPENDTSIDPYFTDAITNSFYLNASMAF